MSTSRDDIIAQIRARRGGTWQLGDGPIMSASDDIDVLIAEVDRLRGLLDGAEAFGTEAHADSHSARTELAALRAAYTWTPATPATMPPASAEFWQVRFHMEGAVWTDTLHSRDNQWMDHHGNMYPIDGTEFAAMPAAPPAQDGGGDAEVTA